VSTPTENDDSRSNAEAGEPENNEKIVIQLSTSKANMS
jgi:hypothetical protein